MLIRASKAIASALLTLWAIATGTFLLIEHAPGGPASAERRLEPEVEAANLARMGLVDLLLAPCAGVLRDVPSTGTEIDAGAPAGHIDGATGGCPLVAGQGGDVQIVLAHDGQTVGAGQMVAAVQRPGIRRYLSTMASIATLDLGVTFTSRGERTVRENLAQGLPISAAVGAAALLIALLLGIPLGLIGAARAGAWPDRMLAVLATAGVSVPAIVLGPLLLYLFALRIPIFPVSGFGSTASLFLPAATLGLILASILQRMTRAGAVDFLQGPVAVSLASRGLRGRRILLVHALRHAAIPMLGYLPPAVAALLTGSIVVETVFNLPGVSHYLVGAAINRDHPMVMGVVLAYSALLVVLNTLAEVLMPIVDPRVVAEERVPEPL